MIEANKHEVPVGYENGKTYEELMKDWGIKGKRSIRMILSKKRDEGEIIVCDKRGRFFSPSAEEGELAEKEARCVDEEARLLFAHGIAEISRARQTLKRYYGRRGQPELELFDDTDKGTLQWAVSRLESEIKEE